MHLITGTDCPKVRPLFIGGLARGEHTLRSNHSVGGFADVRAERRRTQYCCILEASSRTCAWPYASLTQQQGPMRSLRRLL